MTAIAGKRSFLGSKMTFFLQGSGLGRGIKWLFLALRGHFGQKARDPHRVWEMVDFPGQKSVIL